ncbi:MAG: Hsp20/alpha crystallin family protein [Oligoflexia bacterium]
MNENLFEEPESALGMTQMWRPACDVDETDTHFLVSFDLPGVPQDAIKIECRDHQLVVSGERESESKRTEGGAVSRERYLGSFMRSFQLPSAVKAEQVQAHLQDGVLRIAIPKAEVSSTKQIPISTGTTGQPGFFEKLLTHKKGEKAA